MKYVLNLIEPTNLLNTHCLFLQPTLHRWLDLLQMMKPLVFFWSYLKERVLPFWECVMLGNLPLERDLNLNAPTMTHITFDSVRSLEGFLLFQPHHVITVTSLWLAFSSPQFPSISAYQSILREIVHHFVKHI